MYPSGSWRGFWHQDALGRQEMEAFELHFRDGVISGRGVDIVGPFTFSGTYSESTGHLSMVKQYLKKHSVRYEGIPDGEGCFHGTWYVYEDKGTFLMKPDLPPSTGDEPIIRIGTK